MGVPGSYNVVSILAILTVKVDCLATATVTCEGRSEGYYADLQSSCTRYLVCTTTNSRGNLFSCPPGTRFQQSSLVCDHSDMVPCDGGEAEKKEDKRRRSKIIEEEKRNKNRREEREKKRREGRRTEKQAATIFPHFTSSGWTRWNKVADTIQDQHKTTATATSKATPAESAGRKFPSVVSKKKLSRSKPSNLEHNTKEALAGVRWRTLNERVEKNEEVSRRLRPPSQSSRLVFFPGNERKEEKRGSETISLGRHVNHLISQSGRKKKEEESQYSRHVNKKTNKTQPTKKTATSTKLPSSRKQLQAEEEGKPVFPLDPARVEASVVRTSSLDHIPFSRVVGVQAKDGSRLISLADLLHLLTTRGKAVRMIPIPVTTREARYIQSLIDPTEKEDTALMNGKRDIANASIDIQGETQAAIQGNRQAGNQRSSAKTEGSKKEKQEKKVQKILDSQYQVIFKSSEPQVSDKMKVVAPQLKPRGHNSIFDKNKIQKLKQLAKVKQAPPLQYGFTPITKKKQKEKPQRINSSKSHFTFSEELDSLQAPRLARVPQSIPRSSKHLTHLPQPQFSQLPSHLSPASNLLPPPLPPAKQDRKSNLDFLGIFDTRQFFYIPNRRVDQGEPGLLARVVSLLTGQ